MPDPVGAVLTAKKAARSGMPDPVGAVLTAKKAARSGMPGPVGAVLTAKRAAHACCIPDARRVFSLVSLCRGRSLVSNAPAAEPCPFAVETAPTISGKPGTRARPGQQCASRRAVPIRGRDRSHDPDQTPGLTLADQNACLGLPDPVGAVLTAKRAAHACRISDVRRVFTCRGRSLVSSASTAEPCPFAVETAPTILVERLVWYGRSERLLWHAGPCGSGLDREKGRSCLSYP